MGLFVVIVVFALIVNAVGVSLIVRATLPVRNRRAESGNPWPTD